MLRLLEPRNVLSALGYVGLSWLLPVLGPTAHTSAGRTDSPWLVWALGCALPALIVGGLAGRRRSLGGGNGARLWLGVLMAPGLLVPLTRSAGPRLLWPPAACVVAIAVAAAVGACLLGGLLGELSRRRWGAALQALAQAPKAAMASLRTQSLPRLLKPLDLLTTLAYVVGYQFLQRLVPLMLASSALGALMAPSGSMLLLALIIYLPAALLLGLLAGRRRSLGGGIVALLWIGVWLTLGEFVWGGLRIVLGNVQHGRLPSLSMLLEMPLWSMHLLVVRAVVFVLAGLAGELLRRRAEVQPPTEADAAPVASA